MTDTTIVNYVVVVLVGVLTGAILWAVRWGVSLLRAKVGAAEFDRIRSVVASIVASTEQMMINDELLSDARFQWAADHVRRYFPKLTDVQIEQFIEEAVFFLNRSLDDWSDAEEEKASAAPAYAHMSSAGVTSAYDWVTQMPTPDLAISDATIQRIADAVALKILADSGFKIAPAALAIEAEGT